MNIITDANGNIVLLSDGTTGNAITVSAVSEAAPTLSTPVISLVSGTTIQVDTIDDNAQTIEVYAYRTKIGEVSSEIIDVPTFSVTINNEVGNSLFENGWFYSIDNGASWVDISSMVYPNLSPAASTLTISGVSQIKFKVNNNPILHDPSGPDATDVFINSTSLGLDLTTSYNAVESDNYVLIKDVSDIVISAWWD